MSRSGHPRGARAWGLAWQRPQYPRSQRGFPYACHSKPEMTRANAMSKRARLPHRMPAIAKPRFGDRHPAAPKATAKIARGNAQTPTMVVRGGTSDTRETTPAIDDTTDRLARCMANQFEDVQFRAECCIHLPIGANAVQPCASVCVDLSSAGAPRTLQDLVPTPPPVAVVTYTYAPRTDGKNLGKNFGARWAMCPVFG